MKIVLELYKRLLKKKTTCVLCLSLGVQLNSRPLRLINYSNLYIFSHRVSF